MAMNKKELSDFWGVQVSFLDNKIKEVQSVIADADIDESVILQTLNEKGMDLMLTITSLNGNQNVNNRPNRKRKRLDLDTDDCNLDFVAEPRNKRRKITQQMHMLNLSDDDSDKENENPDSKAATQMIVCILNEKKTLKRDKLLSALNKQIAKNLNANNWRQLYQATLGTFEEFIRNHSGFHILKPNKRNFTVELKEENESNSDKTYIMECIAQNSPSVDMDETDAKEASLNVTEKDCSNCSDAFSPRNNHNNKTSKLQSESVSPSMDSEFAMSVTQSPSNNVFALYRYRKGLTQKKTKQESDDEEIGPTTNSHAANKEEADTDDDEEVNQLIPPAITKRTQKKAKAPKLWQQKVFNSLKIKYDVTPHSDYKRHKSSLHGVSFFSNLSKPELTKDTIEPIKTMSDIQHLRKTRYISSNTRELYQVQYDKTYICNDSTELEWLYNKAFAQICKKKKKPKKKKNQRPETRTDYTIQAYIKKTKDITKKSEKKSRAFSTEIEFSLNRLHKKGKCFIVDIPATIALTARSKELTDDIMESMHMRDEYTAKGHRTTSISLLDFACRYDDKPMKRYEARKHCKICNIFPMKHMQKIPCNHTFCPTCVRSHFSEDDVAECPVCEREYDEWEISEFVNADEEYKDDDDDESVCEDIQITQAKQERYGLNVTPFAYQIQTIEWMRERETDRDGLYQYLFKKGQFKNGETFYYSAVLQRLVLTAQLPVIHGGFLCEEMGLGKTVECLALIHCHRRSGNYSTSKQNILAFKENALRKKRVEIKQINNNMNHSFRPKKKKKVYKVVEQTKEYTYYKGKGTLIIGPVSLIGQWEHEIDTRSNGKLQHKRYYGSRSRNIKHYLDFDVIFTTYGVLAKEDGNDRKNHVLHRIQWHRIILDESHYIKNGAARTSININELKANNKWLLSGTPFERPMDLFNQLKFIGIDQEYLNAMKLKLDYVYSEALIKVVKYMMMRHKKGQQFNNKPILTMTEKEEDVIYVEFDAKQKKYYDKLYATAKETFDSYKATNNISRGFIPILSSLHPARQACSGYIANINAIEEQLSAAQENSHKIRTMVQRNSNKSSKELYQLARVEAYNKDGQCVICLECPPDEPLQTPCRHIFCGECIRMQIETNGECPICRKATNIQQLKRPLSEQKDEEKESENHNKNKEDELEDKDTNEEMEHDENENIIKFDAKLKMLISELNILKREKPNDKSLIFTSFSKSLDWMCCELQKNGIKYSTLTGSMTMNKRARNLKQFSDDEDVKVFVLTVRTGAVGLTLTAANHVFMMEPTFNPALHRQAINRVYRLGQQKKVFIHTLIMKDSIEERIWNINKDKQKGDIDNNKNKNMYGNIKDDKAGTLKSTEIEKLFEIQSV